jgi:hypothetical protein
MMKGFKIVSKIKTENLIIEPNLITEIKYIKISLN